jgi:hypothetical protein
MIKHYKYIRSKLVECAKEEAQFEYDMPTKEIKPEEIKFKDLISLHGALTDGT